MAAATTRRAAVVVAAPKYSQLQCAGGSGSEEGINGKGDYASCLMLDVCYDSQAGTLLYYTDGSPILVVNGFKYNFTEPLVLLEPVRHCSGGGWGSLPSPHWLLANVRGKAVNDWPCRQQMLACRMGCSEMRASAVCAGEPCHLACMARPA